MPRIAKSLGQLRDQVDARWPNRSTTNDGWIASAEHRARSPDSDHNENANDVVCALDITHDKSGGPDAGLLAEALRTSGHPALQYIIFNGRISNPDIQNGVWRDRNKGSGDHTEHVHISVKNPDPKVFKNGLQLYDDDRPWNIGEASVPSLRFKVCLPVILQWEGGNDDDPRDPGGRTSRGILQSEWTEWRKTHPGLPSDVWQAPQDQIEAIYKQKYWDVLRCDQIAPGLDLAVFDFGVNSGVGRSAMFLQRLVGTKQDGFIGPLTLDAAKTQPASVLIAQLLNDRMTYLEGLPHWSTFGRGWTNRVNDVRKKALAMAGQIVVAPPPEPIPDIAAILARIELALSQQKAMLSQLIAAQSALRRSVEDPPMASARDPGPHPAPEPAKPGAAATPALQKPSVQLSAGALATGAALQTAGVVGTPFGMGEDPTQIGTLVTMIPIITALVGATGGWGALLSDVGTLLRAIPPPK